MAWVDIDYARSIVKQMYPGDKWRRRVRGMSDDQVLAIYLQHENKCERKKSSKKVEPVTCAVDTVVENQFVTDYGEQLSFGGIF